ncbi:hypothetical protein LCGC14_0824950 [marine sediment metagenome]|uniref:Uncharacterized protein n=1 Tax=marine sediment metagenome TaxID=412755 RepID=A0A0F9PHP7_9ZZZZ
MMYDEFAHAWTDAQLALWRDIRRRMLATPGRLLMTTSFQTPWFDSQTGREVVPIPAPFLAAFGEDGPTGRKD